MLFTYESQDIKFVLKYWFLAGGIHVLYTFLALRFVLSPTAVLSCLCHFNWKASWTFFLIPSCFTWPLFSL